MQKKQNSKLKNDSLFFTGISFLPANCRNICNQISHYLSVYMGVIYYVILQDTAECNYIYQPGKTCYHICCIFLMVERLISMAAGRHDMMLGG